MTVDGLAHCPVFGKYAVRDGTASTTSAGYDDAWTHALGGFRIDWSAGERDEWTLLGDLSNGRSGQPTAVAIFTPPFSALLHGDAAFRGRSVVGRWRRSFPGGGDVMSQAYFDRTTRHEPHYGERRATVDFEMQHRLGPRGRHDLVWGANYRRSSGTFQGVPSLQLVPAHRIDDIAGMFANDEVRLASGRLRLTGGTKLEVDDELDSRELIAATLSRCGASVAAMASAHEAFEGLQRLRPEVLVSDIEMPAEDGYSLMRRVRQLPADAGGQVPACALTAYAGAEDRIRALAAGFQIHVPKPVQPAELVAVVSSLAARSRAS